MLSNYQGSSELIQTQPAAVYLSQLAPGSRRTMREALNAIAAMVSSGTRDAFDFEWHLLRYQHTAAIRSALMEKYAPNTVNKSMAALKRVLRESHRLGLMSAEDYARAVDLRPIKNQGLLKGRSLTRKELEALLSSCTSDPLAAGARDAAMLAILRVGLRRSEVVKLDLSDFDPTSSALTIRDGKGGKDRITYLPTPAIAHVNRWIELRGGAPGALFHPISKAGRILNRRLSDQAVLVIMRRRASAVGVAEFSPHDFRRTFISDLLDAGVDIVTVQKLAGHADPAVTGKYDRRGEVAKRKAVDLLRF